jgi:hypothetical protein
MDSLDLSALMKQLMEDLEEVEMYHQAPAGG